MNGIMSKVMVFERRESKVIDMAVPYRINEKNELKWNGWCTVQRG